jgi:hypothetical protein
MIKASARKTAILIGLALILIAVMYPRKSILASEYSVTVSDATGRGLAGVAVSRYTQDYSSGRNIDHSIEALTDLQGHASFPEEDHRISIAGEVFGCAKQILATGAHASCGVYSDISVSDHHLVELARSDKALQHGKGSLSFTMSYCPSGDYWACTDSARRHYGN